MTELLTAAQMRTIETAAIEAGKVTGFELMERAGRGVVEAAFNEWPELAATSHRAVVLCGPGNNGGDGFVVARLLREAGWSVHVYLYGEEKMLPTDARKNALLWRKRGEIRPVDMFQLGEGWRCDLLIDALFGCGLNRSLPDLGDLFCNMKEMVDCFEVEPGHERGRPAIVAVDIPSGICADSGREFQQSDAAKRFSASAHLTVTFHRAKIGQYLAGGPAQCGKLVTVDIGLGEFETQSRRREIVGLVGAPHPSPMSKLPQSHKYDHGHAIMLSGGVGRGGAARMAARAALRIGAGAVTIGCPPGALIENAAQLDAIMLRSVKDAGALAEVLEDDRLNVVCIGPGLGMGAPQAALLAAVLGKTGVNPRPTVLDADALGLMANEPALFAALHERCVLTPHGGEFHRLFPDIAERLDVKEATGPAYSKVDAVREAAARAGCVVVLKGSDTVIADPDGNCSVNSAQYDRAAPWLATAGSGDVLAGLITGLLARGFAPMRAAETAAWLHVQCALGFGPGLIAEDLPEQLPGVLRQLGV